ncbi:hypothetical protein CPB84DRAFT_1751906 [Gymnopilus junonius]|uniref:CxC6 like cysteine cluster associated with KDZ domain-containing protein n=1 Tax=Gymnopilus junonius TaxID=109634 RepID=A0A9P5NBD3_GYMJU|nr:hypothetical protein CPB84DRAFT_1751906 [Gymnopilus junonius]
MSPLQKFNRNSSGMFCDDHKDRDGICTIIGCTSPVTSGTKTCANADHQAIEKIHIERGQSRFQLQEHLARARVAHPNDSLGEVVNSIHELADVEEEEEIFELPTGQVTPLHTDHVSGFGKKKLHAQFGWKRTHNEQIIVAPCGTMPNHIFFDNNCQLARIVKDDPAFQRVRLTVDVFHFKSKHKITDLFCQAHCNPVNFPELQGEGNKPWYFNSSIAEQTNVWLGSYHSMCHEMLVDKYNFYLDEMILRRNRMTHSKLELAGDEPKNWPSST